MRKITDEQQTATVYLSKENMDILDIELRKNFRTSIEELKNKSNTNRKKVPVRVVEPPKTIKMHRLHYEYSIANKNVSNQLEFGLLDLEIGIYDATMYVKEGILTASVVRESTVNYMVDKMEYSEITLVAEIARYFQNVRCTEIARMLRSSEEGRPTILERVNEHNEIIHDKLVPCIFRTLYVVKKDIIKENIDV